MIRWYSIKDIMAGYSLSKSKLQAMCRSGELGFMRFPDNRFSQKAKGQYIIPESELMKLAEYKIGEPLFKLEHQPSEFLTPRNQFEEEVQIQHVAGDYRAYMDSEAWQSVRKKALKRDGYTCSMCGSGKNLRVHHVNYEHLGMEEELDDLVTLCDECHSKVHVRDFLKEGETV